MELSDEQVEQVWKIVSNSGFRGQHTGNDLLDHLCCMIESRLPQQSFEKALHEVLLLFPAPEWQRMENETKTVILQIQFKAMNNTLRSAGIASACLLLLGALFKSMHWPGASIMFLLGMVLMAAVFLPVFFIMRYRSTGEENRNLTLSILAVGCGLLFCSGMLFKFMHWPYANILLNSAIALLILAYVPVYILSVYRKSVNRTSALANIILMVAAGSTLFLANNRGPSQNMKNQFRLEAEAEKELVARQIEINHKLVESLKNPELTKSHEAIQKLITFIDQTKQEMIMESGGQTDAANPVNWDSNSGVNHVWLESKSHKGSDFANQCRSISQLNDLQNMPTLDTEHLANMYLLLAIQKLSNYQLQLLQFEQNRLLSLSNGIPESETPKSNEPAE